MGGQRYAYSILDVDPYLQLVVNSEDDYIRRRRLVSQNVITQVLIYPIWKIRSEFEDAMFPIQVDFERVVQLQMDLGLGSLVLNKRNYNSPEFQNLLVEDAACHRIYSKYMMKLRRFEIRTLNLFHAMFDRKPIMIEVFRYICSHLSSEDQDEACIMYAQKLYYVLEMCLLLRQAIMDSIANARSVLECSTLSLLETTQFYYNSGIPLPNGSIELKNLMQDLWDQIEREHNDPLNFQLGQRRCLEMILR